MQLLDVTYLSAEEWRLGMEVDEIEWLATYRPETIQDMIDQLARALENL